MTDRVILAVKFTPAGAASQVRRAVGGFLRYVQHRDLHRAQRDDRARPEVSGLLKYVAYRDRSSARAELFGPSGSLSTEDRKAFAAFVADALDRSTPQPFRGRDGQLHDRRRAVYRLVISPERAVGLDLRRLTDAAVRQLEADSGITGVRWIAAVHRNTAHPHVHLVIAGMHFDGSTYRRVEITKRRLSAMKEAVGNEITRQRSPQTRTKPGMPVTTPARPLQTPCPLEIRSIASLRRPAHQGLAYHRSLMALRAVARSYRHQVERDAREEARRRGWEMAA